LPAPADRPVLNELAERLLTAMQAFDEVEADATVDQALGRLSLDAALATVILPALAEVGERWLRGELTIAQEHFCTELLRGRLLGVARGWGAGGGPLALLACPPGERHDLGLIAFGLSLRGRGWRVAFLGADTPPETLADTAQKLDPAVVVVAATVPQRFERALRPLRALAEYHALLIAGAGANRELARSLGAAHLEGDPIYAAGWVAGERSAGSSP
jgi:methanogenic corrinoid protein MtbC1